ncbi:MAG: hypothetical protein WA188_00945 [Terriglobales bacterium]
MKAELTTCPARVQSQLSKAHKTAGPRSRWLLEAWQCRAELQVRKRRQLADIRALLDFSNAIAEQLRKMFLADRFCAVYAGPARPLRPC